jgi:hypothetical protein
VIFGWQGWGGVSANSVPGKLLLFWNGAKRYDFQSFWGYIS